MTSPDSAADTTASRPSASALAPGRAGAVRSRFAPSPTGFLHIGGARTALFAWAFARHFGGSFVLRIEDTDLERSTPEAVQAIVDGMAWLGLTPDEGPFYQTRRMDRYREVIDAMLADGRAYHCHATPAELEQMREQQRAAGLKPRYDGRWRPERAARDHLEPPAGSRPVVRFRNPDEGVVHWDDLVKGPIAIANAELDDLIIARADGSPTYNFCVVVDDHDMGITHVIRGDDHVNNTPRQINILRALGAELPRYGHLPMIHGPDGQKLSKRHGAVSVMQYEQAGYLPEAMINYLARLGWSHGDDELFSREQLVGWFDGSHLSQSPAQFDLDKLDWVNQHYLKAMPDQDLAIALEPYLLPLLGAAAKGGADRPPREWLAGLAGLMKERTPTLVALAGEIAGFLNEPAREPLRADVDQRAAPGSREALQSFHEALGEVAWQPEAIGALVKSTVAGAGLKMPQFAMPLRALVFGRLQTPAVDQMLAAMPRDTVRRRLAEGLAWW